MVYGLKSIYIQFRYVMSSIKFVPSKFVFSSLLRLKTFYKGVCHAGIVSMRPHPGNRPTHSPKNRSLFPSNKRRCKEDKPDGQTPVTKTTTTKTFSNKDRSIKAPTTQSDEYLEPVLAGKEKEQTLERPSSSHCNYYSYPSIAYNNQHPSNSSRSSKQPQ